MKKLWILPLLILVLSGCSAQETLEIVSDIYAVPVSANASRLELTLPEEAAQPVMESDSGSLYLCEDYAVTVQTMEAGDVAHTLQSVTGFDREDLTVMQTERDGVKRYECAWTAVGEGTDQICRTVILDNGCSHYAVTVMADYAQAARLTDVWNHILDSAKLVSTD